jgi:hypothetical protein
MEKEHVGIRLAIGIIDCVVHHSPAGLAPIDRHDHFLHLNPSFAALEKKADFLPVSPAMEYSFMVIIAQNTLSRLNF